MRLLRLTPFLIVFACASGGTAPFPQDSGNTPDSAVDCDPACVPPATCESGACVTPGTDADSDGVPADIDCNDGDPSVGRIAERTCSSECGAGVERCTDAFWDECTAPTTCDCTPGDPPRMIPCERCGMQRQICMGGRWVDEGGCSSGECSPGESRSGGPCGACGTLSQTCQMDCTWGGDACNGEGACMPGATENEMQACGGCGDGTQLRTRSCGATCAWGAWGAWGACTGGATECTVGEMEMETRACGNCDAGSQTRTRSCSAACVWDTWSAWSTCAGGGACAPGATRPCANGDSCGAEVCDGTCTWGGCQPNPAIGSACLRIAPGSTTPGTNFQCCDPGDGGPGWQFCLSSCAWAPCASNACS
ncbi:MAG: hypothetical protein AAGE52_15880 [Myxococcota bacterium]